MKRKNLSILNIEGVPGSGVTTQVKRLAGHILKNSLTIRSKSKEDIEENIEKANDFLSTSDPNKHDRVVINDGFLATIICEELVYGEDKSNILNRYRGTIKKIRDSAHKYDSFNLILILDDLDECNKRLNKNAQLLKKTSYKVVDLDKGERFIEELRRFDHHVLSEGIKFNVLNIKKSDTVMDVEGKILKLLKDNDFKF